MAEEKEIIEFVADVKIVKASTPEELEKKIVELLKKDFEPDGDMVVFDGNLLQKMVLVDIDEDK